MGPRSRRTAQEGDLFCLLEMNVPISTGKQVIYRHNLKGRSAGKKPLLQNRHEKARLRFTTAHVDKDCNFWRNAIWSDETKI